MALARIGKRPDIAAQQAHSHLPGMQPALGITHTCPFQCSLVITSTVLTVCERPSAPWWCIPPRKGSNSESGLRLRHTVCLALHIAVV